MLYLFGYLSRAGEGKTMKKFQFILKIDIESDNYNKALDEVNSMINDNWIFSPFNIQCIYSAVNTQDADAIHDMLVEMYPNDHQKVNMA